MYVFGRFASVIRHYDVTGKICPKYYVEHEDAWDTFIDDVKVWIRTESVIRLYKSWEYGTVYIINGG